MLPGKKYTPEDVLKLVRRRIWWLLVPLAVVSAAAGVLARVLPDYYKSTSLVLVVPSRVSETFVKSSVTINLNDRLQSIKQQLLSRTRLETIIKEENLYQEELRTGILEDVVQNMRADIDVRIERGDAFTVSFVGRDPQAVQRVTAKLTSSFITESLRDRSTLAESANQFLETQLEDARLRLKEQEERLANYKRRFAGELPSDLGGNQQAISNIQMQVQQLVDGLNNDTARRNQVLRELAQMEPGSAETPGAPAPLPPQVYATPEAMPATGSLAQQLETAKFNFKQIEARYQPTSYVYRQWKRTVDDLQRKVDDEALNRLPVSDLTPRMSPTELARQKRIADLRGELDDLNAQIKAKSDEEKRLRAAGTFYQDRVNRTPTRDIEMVELNRDYAITNDLYNSLLRRKEDSKVSANLERQQIGETFRLLDQAKVAERPFSPDRRLIGVAGLVIGLALGIGLIALLEYRDESFKTEDEIASVLGLSVLATVPFMQSDADKRRSRIQRVFLNVGLGTTVMVCMAVVVYTLVR
jgi:polysaccharide chain length determinant protein (PEP-CTERM system associated)